MVKQDPVDIINSILIPVVIMVLAVVGILWAASQISTTITFSLMGIGSGALLAATGVLVIVYYKIK